MDLCFILKRFFEKMIVPRLLVEIGVQSLLYALHKMQRIKALHSRQNILDIQGNPDYT